MDLRIRDEHGNVYVYGAGRITAPTGKPTFFETNTGNSLKITFMVTVNVKKKPQLTDDDVKSLSKKGLYDYTNLNCTVYFANVGRSLFSLARTLKLYEKIEFVGKWHENIYTDPSTGETRTLNEVIVESFTLPDRIAELILKADNLNVQSKSEIKSDIEKKKKGIFGGKKKEEETYLF